MRSCSGRVQDVREREIEGVYFTVWYGMEDGKPWLWAVMQEDGVFRIMRGDPQGRFERAYGFGCYKSREIAQDMLDAQARSHGWCSAACGICWHLRNKGQSCNFFFSPIEGLTLERISIRLRCKKCLDWGEIPPG